MSLDAFSKLADSLIDETWLTRSDVAPDIVYHYTNAAGLFGILKSKKLWITDCRFLNDSLESQLGLKAAKEFVRQNYYGNKDQHRRPFYRTLKRILDTDPDEPNFVFSFSERDDDLTQWRTYANEGEGFTIGFDAKGLIQRSGPQDDEFAFGQVSYNAHTQQTRIRRAIQKFEKLYLEQSAEFRGEPDNIEDVCLNLDSVISSYSASYKHSSFRSEREWRVSSFVEAGDPNNEIEVRTAGHRLIPYISIDIGPDSKHEIPIRRVGIGPGFRDGAISYAVMKLCDQCAIEPEIYSADTPYRRV